MDENVGDADALVRILLGAVAGVLSLGTLTSMLPSALSLPTVSSPVLGVLAFVLLGTGFTSKCALYNALGIDTSK
jgi:hypothetical protein